MKYLLLSILFAFFTLGLCAQNSPRITGNLQSNGNFFITDSAIVAVGTPQYDYQKFGAESWLALNYSNWGFDVGLRFDMFNNSNLLNPTSSYTAEGIGRWYVHKQVDKFDLSGGYLYDQIGSGIIFRAYEERSLMIDNALVGVKLGYQINDNWKLRAFSGRTKRQFERYGSVVHGAALEGFIKPDSAKNFTLAPGIGVVARTYDKETVDDIVSSFIDYRTPDRFSPQYNTYAATIFNTMTAGDFTWYFEGAGKTKDVIYYPNAERFVLKKNAQTGQDELVPVTGRLANQIGYTFYTSLSYAKSGLGITLEAKRTKDFSFRGTPSAFGVQGPINFLPPMAKQNTYRLTARFAPATQEFGEQAIQLDAHYSLSKKLSVGVNLSDIQNLDGKELYREIAPEFVYKHKRKWQFIGGVQLLKYEIEVYQQKKDPADDKKLEPLSFLGAGKANYVDALTPYAEWLYRFTPRRSLRIEAQYLITDDEFGSWVNGLAEIGLAPHWLFYVSDMYKLKHTDSYLSKYQELHGEPFPQEKTRYDGIHYPSVGVVYTQKANRFAIAYVKQVEGINCAGGICRLEPTFHGIRVNVSSSF